MAAGGLHQRAPTLAPDLHGELLRIGTVGRVAVEAAAGQRGLGQQWRFVEVVEAALVDAQVAAHLVARRNAAIDKPIVVERLGADVDGKVAVAQPSAAAPFAHADRYASARVQGCQAVPVVGVELHVGAALRVQASANGAGKLHVYALGGVALKAKVERRNAGRDGHARIVGEDGRQSVHRANVGGPGAA